MRFEKLCDTRSLDRCILFKFIFYISRTCFAPFLGFSHIFLYTNFIYNVVVQFYPSFKFYFPLFWGMVMCDNEFETKGNKI